MIFLYLIENITYLICFKHIFWTSIQLITSKLIEIENSYSSEDSFLVEIFFLLIQLKFVPLFNLKSLFFGTYYLKSLLLETSPLTYSLLFTTSENSNSEQQQ